MLTGGTIAARTHPRPRDSRAGLDRLACAHVWWSDERFLPTGDLERNETQVRAALLDAVPLDPARVHPMPATDGPDGDDPKRRRSAMPTSWRRYAVRGPWAGADFDLLLLGMGPDGTCPLFPDWPAVYETERTVVAVRGAPKPPPIRSR